jgi:amino acid transporter
MFEPFDYAPVPILIFSAVLCLIALATAVNFKRITNIKNELKKRELSDEENAFNKKNAKTSALKYFGIIFGSLLAVAIIFVVVCLATGSEELLPFVNSSPSTFVSESENTNPGGFIGSDGEYHNYIPEFGDDVNNWMEENW